MRAAQFTLILAGVRQIGHPDVVLANSRAVLLRGGGLGVIIEAQS